MDSSYSLTCVNNSSSPGRFVVFQKPPGSGSNLSILAWFAKAAHPGTQVTFRWTTDYCFVWAETGVVTPAISFKAWQIVAADPASRNLTQLTQDAYAATYFTAPTDTGVKGRLMIQVLGNVIPHRTSVGIGMSSSATMVLPAMPNFNVEFALQPDYWVAFGNYVTGQLLDLQHMTGAAEVVYPAAATSRTATLGPDNVITVT
jgi:hypothetical protein